MMQLLAQRVPLTLILDLVSPPDAQELYATEQPSSEWPRLHLPATKD